MTALNRRELLGAGLSVPLLAAATRGVSAATAQSFASPLIVSISGIDSRSDLNKVEAVCRGFIDFEIPVLVTVSPFGEHATVNNESPLPAFLRRMMVLAGDRLEVGLHLDSEGDESFAQVRQVSTAQAAFCQMINVFEWYQTRAIITATSLTTRVPFGADNETVRAAGIRSVLRLPGDPDNPAIPSGGYSIAGNGVLNLFCNGASSFDGVKQERQAVDAMGKHIDTLAKSGQPIVVNVAAAFIEQQPLAGLPALVSGIVAAIATRVQDGRLRLLLPRLLQRQTSPDKSRLVVVRVDDLRVGPTSDEAHIPFVERLANDGVPLSEAVIAAPLGAMLSSDRRALDHIERMQARDGYELVMHGYAHTPSELLGKTPAENVELALSGAREIFRNTGIVPTIQIPPNNAYDDSTLHALGVVGIPMISGMRGDFRWFGGVDRRGILHVSNTVMFEKHWDAETPYWTADEMVALAGEWNDITLCIHPNTATTAERVDVVQDTVTRLAAMAGTRLANFGEFHRSVMPPLPVAGSIQQARATLAIGDWLPAEKRTLSRQDLLDDARHAWSFFDWGAKQFNGLVPATTWEEDGKQAGYPFMTMWDVGTYIFAVLAASRIGLIDDKELDRRVQAILTLLRSDRYALRGSRLPAIERRIGKQRGERRGFDSADTGRLLIALKHLDQESDGRYGIASLVAKWDFTPVLKGGDMHVVKPSGRTVNVQRNSYTGYVSRGFRLWGYDVNPAFVQTDVDDDMQSAIAVVTEIEERGRIATEPLLTEEIELGGSRHSRLAADLLYAAQIDNFKRTGELTCVSEMPVPGAPFFTYQGYQLIEGSGQFVVDKPHGRTREGKMADRLRAVSSKAAYLWYAARPGDYSNLLITHIREKARMAQGYGFASGTWQSTGERMEISDINTNGIILESIAYLLSGRPLMQAERVASAAPALEQ